MPHFQSLLLATPIECEPLKRVIAPDAASQSPLKIAQIQAIDHIHCAAEIITAAMSYVPDGYSLVEASTHAMAGLNGIAAARDGDFGFNAVSLAVPSLSRLNWHGGQFRARSGRH